MKKLISLLVFAFACQSSAQIPYTPYDDSRGDGDAAYSQVLMKNAVKIKESLTVEDTPSDPLLQADSFETWFSGSGVVIDVDKETGKSFILTAWHVCDTYPVGYEASSFMSKFKVIKQRQIAITADNREFDVEVIYKEKETDLCLLSVDYVFPTHARLANRMPPRGSYVDVVGSPKGSWGNYLVSMSRGQYFGITNLEVVLGHDDIVATKLKGFGYFSFPGIGGYSGSGIYYRGELVGIHTAGDSDFEHASYGPTISTIKRVLKKAAY